MDIIMRLAVAEVAMLAVAMLMAMLATALMRAEHGRGRVDEATHNGSGAYVWPDNRPTQDGRVRSSGAK